MAALKQIFEEDGSDDSDSDDDDSSEDAGQNSLWHMLPLLKGTVLGLWSSRRRRRSGCARSRGSPGRRRSCSCCDTRLEDASEEHDRLCIVLEDAQYMDPTSWRMLEQVADLTGVVLGAVPARGACCPSAPLSHVQHRAVPPHCSGRDGQARRGGAAPCEMGRGGLVRHRRHRVRERRGESLPLRAAGGQHLQTRQVGARPDAETNGTVGLAPHVEPHDIKFPEGCTA